MTNRKAKRKATSVPPSNQPTTSEQNPQTDGGVKSTEDRLAEELLQIIKANPQLYDWDETTRTVMLKGDAEKKQQKPKKNASSVSVMPIRNNLFARILHAFDLTMEEYLGLKSCTPGIKSSECTARQRLILQQMKQRRLVKVVEYPHLFDGPAWVPDTMGEIKLEGASLFAREQEIPIDSSQETSRSRGRRSVAHRGPEGRL